MNKFFIFLLVCFPFSCFANITLTEDDKRIKYGKLNSDQTWQGDIYLVSDVIVPEGITLTIEPGTKLYFAEYDIAESGEDPLQTEIIVKGKVNAKSTKENPILVTSIGKSQWLQLNKGDKSVQIKFKPYLIDTKPMTEEFRQFKTQYQILWSVIYAMWILAF